MRHVLANERGSAILICLALMGFLALLAISAADRATTDIQMAYNQAHEEQAFYVADAGLKLAQVELDEDETWRDGFAQQAFGEGHFTVSVSDSGVLSALKDTVHVQSAGECSDGLSVVEGWFIPNYRRPFRWALFADKGIKMENQACTDSYNSDSGSYADTQLDEQGSVGSNATIILEDNTTVGGDASSATPGGITIGGGSDVTGDTTSTADSVKFDLIPESEYTWAKTVSKAPIGFSGSGYSYNASTKNLKVSAGGTLTLTSGVYYFNSLKMEANAQIKLAAGAKVTLYVAGDVLLENATKMNAGGQPANLMIFSKGTTFKLENDSEFYGSYYGPNALFKIENNTNMYGSVLAGTVIMENLACFHYDRDLGSFTKGVDPGMQLVAWQER